MTCNFCTDRNGACVYPIKAQTPDPDAQAIFTHKSTAGENYDPEAGVFDHCPECGDTTPEAIE